MTSRRSKRTEWPTRLAAAGLIMAVVVPMVIWRSVLFEVLGWASVGFMTLLAIATLVAPDKEFDRGGVEWDEELQRLLDNGVDN